MRARSAHAVMLFAAWATMHPAAQQRPIETFRSGREVLTIDTSVRDADGRPLTDLKPADFVVRIDGQPRAVLTARMFGTDAGRVTNDGRVMNDVAPIPRFTSTAEASPGRIVVFAIDRTSIRPGGEKAAIETAAALLDALSPADPVGAAGLPTGGIELTRDHAAVAKVIRQMTGTAPQENTMSWEQALEGERECNHVPDPCLREFEIAVRSMLLVGRAQANSILSSLSGLLDRMGPLSAPKHLVLISGGLPFDTEILPRYQMLAAKAAQSHVALFVVHLDQPSFDATDQRPSAFSRRRLVSEFALVRTADVAGWVGFRDVIEIDGRRMGDRQDRLQKLFSGGSATVAEGRRIADESAWFNLGPMRRNFNEPTSALFFLIPQSQARFTFTRKRETSVGGVDVWEIAFKETATPTLIRTTDGLDVPSEGTVWVTPSDGTVVQTRLVLGGFAGPSSSSNVEVTYARDPRLGIWLPATMKERHDGFLEKASSAGRGIRTVAEHSAVMGTATYSDFKRFETSAIIK